MKLLLAALLLLLTAPALAETKHGGNPAIVSWLAYSTTSGPPGGVNINRGCWITVTPEGRSSGQVWRVGARLKIKDPFGQTQYPIAGLPNNNWTYKEASPYEAVTAKQEYNHSCQGLPNGDYFAFCEYSIEYFDDEIEFQGLFAREYVFTGFGGHSGQ